LTALCGDESTEEDAARPFPGIDGADFFADGAGGSLPQGGDGAALLRDGVAAEVGVPPSGIAPFASPG
jgi:hypothetical protein